MPRLLAGRSRWLAMAAVALLGASTVGAQERRLEVGGTLGWTFSDGVRGGVVGDSGLLVASIAPDNGLSYALFATYFVNENLQLGVQASRQESELHLSGDRPLEITSMDIEGYHAVSTLLLGDDELLARPYFLFGLGVTRFGRVNFTGLDGVPRGIPPQTRFSPTIGTGAKFYLPSRKYGLNLALRWTPTFLPRGDNGFWCNPYFGCLLGDNSQFVHQLELAGGIQLRF